MYYMDITTEDLTKLRDGLSIVERVYRNSGEDVPKLWLYGLTSDPNVLDACKEAIAQYGDDEFTEEDVELAEVVVELQLSGDTMYYLLGSGVKLAKGDEFVFMGQQGEGARTIDFGWARHAPMAAVNSFKKMALAPDSGYGTEFLTKYGQKIPLKVNVQRTQPATPAPAPAAPTASVDEHELDKWLDRGK